MGIQPNNDMSNLNIYIPYTQKWDYTGPSTNTEYRVCSSGNCPTDSVPNPENCDNEGCKFFKDPLGDLEPIDRLYALTQYAHCGNWNEEQKDQCAIMASGVDSPCPPFNGQMGNNLGFVRNDFTKSNVLNKYNLNILCQYPAKGLVHDNNTLKNFLNITTRSSDTSPDKESVTVNSIIADYCILGESLPCAYDETKKCPPIFSTDDSAKLCQDWYDDLQTINNPDLNNIYNTKTQMYCNKEENINKLECSCINATNDVNPNKYHELYLSLNPSGDIRPYCALQVCRPNSYGTRDNIFKSPSYYNDRNTCSIKSCTNVVINKGTMSTDTINQTYCNTTNNENPSDQIMFNRYTCNTDPPCSKAVPTNPHDSQAYDISKDCQVMCIPPSSSRAPPSSSRVPPSPPPSSNLILNILIIVLVIAITLVGSYLIYILQKKPIIVPQKRSIS